jgi:hypothetical protein
VTQERQQAEAPASASLRWVGSRTDCVTTYSPSIEMKHGTSPDNASWTWSWPNPIKVQPAAVQPAQIYLGPQAIYAFALSGHMTAPSTDPVL